MKVLFHQFEPFMCMKTFKQEFSWATCKDLINRECFSSVGNLTGKNARCALQSISKSLMAMCVRPNASSKQQTVCRKPEFGMMWSTRPLLVNGSLTFCTPTTHSRTSKNCAALRSS